MLRDAFTADCQLTALFSEAADNGVAGVRLGVGAFFLLLICRKPQKQWSRTAWTRPSTCTQTHELSSCPQSKNVRPRVGCNFLAIKHTQSDVPEHYAQPAGRSVNMHRLHVIIKLL